MKAVLKKATCLLAVGFITTWTATLEGCAYRLYGPIPPSQEFVRIVAAAPEQYAVQVDTRNVYPYEVPRDGRIKITIPSYRYPCGVYLFNAVKVGGYGDPIKAWSVSVTRNGKTVRKLSVEAVRKLAIDRDGYHVLQLTD